MGVYINPPDCTKEQWLKDHGVLLLLQPKWELIEGTGMLPVALVFNVAFTAAAICYSKREMEAYTPTKEDLRLRLWFLVKESSLLAVEPSLFGYLEEIRKEDNDE